MIKVLILAYDFPPYVSVGGLRPYNWYRYLNEYGIYPIVVTRQWGNEYGNDLDYIAPGTSNERIVEETEFGTILRTPYRPNLSNRMMLKYGKDKYRFFRRAMTFLNQIGQHLSYRGPKSGLYRGAKQFLRTEKVDFILATGDPFILFKYASKLSKQHSIPWIADYRDLWIGHDRVSFRSIDAKLLPYLERRYLKNVHSVSTVSQFLETQLKKNLPNKKFHLQLNGYNPEVMNGVKDLKQNSEVLTISISGTINAWHPLEGFLANCEEFIQRNLESPVRIKFYGTNINAEILELAKEKFSSISPMIEVIPRLQNEALAQEMARDNLFLLFNDYSILGTKIFDYIGIQRKILLCFSDDQDALNLKLKHFNFDESPTTNTHLQSDAILDTNSGVIIQNGEHLQAILKELSDEFQRTGSILCDSTNIDAYSRKLQVENFAKYVQASILSK
ncbi:MAG: glycosyltransferase involved in cell wall biosynthesis [Crocinitomicaceae bacterium]|jgi:glycosyltransferase involved in cell wall biosynthesis